jgi:hypothetical protein
VDTCNLVSGACVNTWSCTPQQTCLPALGCI